MGLPDITRLDHPFLEGHPDRVVHSTDPQAWAELVSGMIPVRVCEPLHGRQPFHNATALIDLGTIAAVSSRGSPISVQAQQQEVAHLMVPYAGDGVWTLDGRRYANPAGESVLFLPPSPLQLENTLTAGVSLNIPPECLLRTALTMAGPDGIGRDLGRLLLQPRRLRVDEAGNRELLACLYSTLAGADHAMRAAPGVLPLLRFDDQLVRLTLLLLVPELRGLSAPAGGGAAPRRRGEVELDDLIAWIEAHLHRPLSLSDLESQAHCSRRTLQVHFRRRFGCTPMQWLRRRRMRQALERLRHPGPGESIWTIAQACGYTNLSAFSREFRAMHGQRPSEVLRAAAPLPPAGPAGPAD